MSWTSARLPRVVLGLVLGLVLLGAVAGCTAGPNEAVASGADAGFWLGLWHGFIVPVTFVISLFTETVSIYEVDNNGNWYDFGFVLGVIAVLSGSGGAGAASRR